MEIRDRVRPSKFFRNRLLSVRDLQGLRDIINEMKAERKELMDHVQQIMWHMRSMSREEAWSLSPDERKGILAQVDERIKQVEKTGLAVL